MQEVFQAWETERKYYRAHLSQDLFGDWIVERTWGSKISRRAGEKPDYCFSYQDGICKLSNIGKRRMRHQYKAE